MCTENEKKKCEICWELQTFQQIASVQSLSRMRTQWKESEKKCVWNSSEWKWRRKTMNLHWNQKWNPLKLNGYLLSE